MTAFLRFMKWISGSVLNERKELSRFGGFFHFLSPYFAHIDSTLVFRLVDVIVRLCVDSVFASGQKKPRPPREERDIKQLDFLFQHRHKRFRATTANRPFSVEYSHVDSTISLSPYRAVTPVS